MAVSLHHLRWKIAGAAVVKGAVARAARIPGMQRKVTRLAHRLQPEGEHTGSYRGLLAGLLMEATAVEDTHYAVAYDAVAGLVPSAAPDTAPDVHQLRRRAETHHRAGDWIALAAAYRKSYIGEFDASAAAYHHAFTANPKDLRAIEGVLVSGARSHYDWPRIWQVAHALKPTKGPLAQAAQLWTAVDPIFTQHPDTETVQRAVTQVQAYRKNLPTLHQLLLETLSVRLQFLGRFRTGTEIRRAMAENRVAELRGIPLESALWLKHLLGAHAYLDHPEQAVRLAQRPPLDMGQARVRTQVQKLRADASLFIGDAEPLIAHSLQRRHDLPLPGDEAMGAWVTGRRVAVVGPAAGGEELGDIIDSYDVVVRTRPNPQVVQAQGPRIGSRTDIAYYSGLDLIRGYDQVKATVESGGFQLAVVRPHCQPALPEPPEWLRVARFEFGLYFRGAPLGIQRILYDLLQFAPAEIGLFHADFYAGAEVLAAGYRDEATVFGPHSPLNDPVVMHDLSFEFRFTQRLARAGLIQPRGVAAEVLALTEDQYLTRLEHGPLGAGTTP